MKFLRKIYFKSFLLGYRMMPDKNFYPMKMVTFRFPRTLEKIKRNTKNKISILK